MSKKFYITTAIDYVNGKPHIGHALEKAQADVLARYHRALGEDVFFLTGTDEHGAKIARAAENAGVPVKKFVETNTNRFKELIKALNISNDLFIRTSDKKIHWPSVEKMWKALDKNGDIYKKKYKGAYCVGHEAFVTKKDLVDGKCVLHKAKPEIINEENYFFRLSKYTKDITKYVKSGKFSLSSKVCSNVCLLDFRDMVDYYLENNGDSEIQNDDANDKEKNYFIKIEYDPVNDTLEVGSNTGSRALINYLLEELQRELYNPSELPVAY